MGCEYLTIELVIRVGYVSVLLESFILINTTLELFGHAKKNEQPPS